MASTIVNLADRLAAFASTFDDDLERALTDSDSAPQELHDAMRYALLGPGKRLRPFLVHRCCALAGGTESTAFAPAVALEMVHAFSLVHDDLPAMDNDDLRRGQPTCHRQFDEATAILAGDALLALAFETLAAQPGNPARVQAMMVELARAVGWRGMIGGQAADLAGERQPPSLARVRDIHERKTGALFAASCRLGVLAGGGDADLLERLGGYGRHLGLAFQIADDLLDVTATAEQLGKQVGKDSARRKQTYPACVGNTQAQAAGREAVAAALKCLSGLGAEADDLRALAEHVLNRRA